MATLELLIDASGATRGAQQAEAALGRVKTAAEATATTTARVGQSLSGAFQAANGSVQIAQGISQTAAAFTGLNTAMGVFAASRTILEIGNTARDFQQFRSSVGGATSALSVLGLAIRANPIGAIATVIGLAATAMSIFGSNTREATKEVKAQETELQKLLATGRIGGIESRNRYGVADPRTSVSGTIDTLATLRQDGSAPLGIGSAATLFGVQESEIRRLLAESNRSTDYLEYDLSRRQRFPGQAPSYLVGQASAGDVIRAGETLLGQRRQQEGLYQFGAPYSGPLPGPAAFPFTDNSVGPNDYVSQSADDRMRVEQENADRIQESMARAADYAGQIGDAFGSSLADVLFKTASLRQVFQSILQQSVRDGLGGIGRSAFQAVLGLTTNQQGANAGIRKPGES